MNIYYFPFIFILLDFIYLSTMKTYFQNQVKTIQQKILSFNMKGAILCYIFLLYGLYHFILKQKKNYIEAFIYGFIMYGVYETTNYTIFDDWKLKTVIIDTLWGGLLFSMTTFFIQNV